MEDALALKRQPGCRVTVDVMDLWPETFTRLIPGGSSVRSLVGRILFASKFRKARRGYREADGVSAVSQGCLNLIKQTAPDQKAHLCYVGGELIQPRKQSVHPSNQKISPSGFRSLSPPTARFIYVGAMTSTYDVDTIIEASKLLKSEGLNFEIIFAGSRVSEDHLKEKVAALGLEDTVQFFGFLNQSELQAALLSADVRLNTIMPGTFITMPHKLSEYLCAGLAVIYRKEGEADALLQSNEAGTFYMAQDVKALANAVRPHIKSPEKLEEEKSNARQLAATGFSGAGELYRDRYHMNNVGRYVAALTTYAVVTGSAASDLGADSTVGFGAAADWLADRVITDALRVKLTELVDRVIAQKPFEDLPLTLNHEFKGVSFKTYTGFQYTSEQIKFWSSTE